MLDCILTTDYGMLRINGEPAPSPPAYFNPHEPDLIARWDDFYDLLEFLSYWSREQDWDDAVINVWNASGRGPRKPRHFIGCVALSGQELENFYQAGADEHELVYKKLEQLVLNAITAYETKTGDIKMLKNSKQNMYQDTPNPHPAGSLNHLGWSAFHNACDKGFHDSAVPFGTYTNCITEEVIELWRAYRKGQLADPSDKVAGLTVGAEELADIIIIATNLGHQMGVDMDAAVQAKAEYNTGREHMHGGRASE